MKSTGTSIKVALAIASASIAVTVASFSAPVAADGCNILCGGIQNTSGRTMHYTRALNSSTHLDWCDIWNKEGGNSWQWAHWKCGQRSLANGDVAGGPLTEFDVDAFTFNDARYEVSFDGGETWRRLDPGVWTKISDAEFATCYAESPIRCYID